MTPAQRAELLYAAGEDLWRAADALHEARQQIRRAEDREALAHGDKLQGMTEGLAHRVELAADGVMEEVNG